MTHEARSALLRAALDSAERGWHVHPLRPGGKAPALHGEESCPRTGECAAGHRKWEQRATLDTDRIHAAWGARPFNVGIATGPSGLIVVDLDMPKPEDGADTPSGVTSFKALCERAGQAAPTTHTVRTPSGGRHLYFTAPPGVRLPSSKGTLAKKIDTRAWGGNVVAAGSTTRDGTYETVEATAPVPLPAWLLDALKPAPRPAGPLRLAAPRNSTRLAQVALERETAAVAAATEGGREQQLFLSARAIGRFVAWGDIPRHEVEAAFQAAGESVGLKPSECRSTLRSVLNWCLRTARPRETA
ncbi:bifunctional DNA primase/polymerase [Streptomyces sp. NA02950]|uniref:bifunctional DNA primase/polymerase n=1 Tax=Streptomyces sp. NA02950 TaxID=2742137 RepID=UPI0015901DDC|nr:bifunctional DNA primase/polymerase [Streptomyces sp. NA02950]QKV94008.1 bifunctional DNA primase/polymerase [Streptomyces sp. NA02950]